MNKVNNDINKFDGKYLKCIVTKYKSALNYLTNSGTLLILQPINANNRNYIYLGDEFLASGYGFPSEENQNKAIEIVNNFDKTIKNLSDSINTESNERINSDNELVEELKKYVLSDGGQIQDTVIKINDTLVKTSDIILYGEEAKYFNLEVDSFKFTILDNSGNIYELENINDMHIEVPMGSEIVKIKIEITTKDNDSGGLEYLKVLHDFNNGAYDENEGLILKYNVDTENKVEEDNINSVYNLHKWFYEYDLSSYIDPVDTETNAGIPLIVKKQLFNIVKALYLYVKATPVMNYKYYPGLLKEKGYKIISSGNAIQPNKINLHTTLDIDPVYYMQWTFKDFTNQNNNLIDLFNKNSLSLNKYWNDYGYYSKLNLNLDINIVHLNINYEPFKESRMITFSIPSNFTLENVYILKKSINNFDHTNVNTYDKEQCDKYNITGIVRILSKNINLPCPLSVIKETKETLLDENDNEYEHTVTTFNTIQYDNYSIVIKEGNNILENLIKEGCELELIIRTNKYYASNGDENKYFNECVTINYDELLNTSIFKYDEEGEENIKYLNYLINDETFNILYWLNGKPHYIEPKNNDILSLVRSNQESVQYVKNQLKKISNNGTNTGLNSIN